MGNKSWVNEEVHFLIVKEEEPNNEIFSLIDDIHLLNRIKFLKANIWKLNWFSKLI